MKIMVYEGPRKLIVAETSDNPMGRDEVRIKTLYSGISHGTEMNVYRGAAPFFRSKNDPETRLFTPASESEKWTYPIRSCDPGVWYMGYANVGEIIETGADVREIKKGNIVFSNSPHQSQAVKKETEVVRIPDSIDPGEGVFFTNLITTFNGILDTKIKLGDTLVVSGLGVLGQLCIQMAKMSGAFKVYGVDVLNKRLDTAMENGADGVFNPLDGKDIAKEIRRLTGNRGADAVIEVSGNQKALNEAVRIAAPDTVITALGWYQGGCGDMDLSEEFHHNRVSIKCSQMGSINSEFRHMWDFKRREKTCLELLGKLKLGNLITHRIPYDEISSAYEMIDKNPSDIIQVVLTY